MGRLKDYELYGSDCLAGSLPACSCSCPLNIDVRGILGNLKKGNFKAAYRHFRDAAVFPLIVSEICDAPCVAACVRSGKDAGVRIGDLERALCDVCGQAPPPKFNLPAKPQKVAVVGGGLCGLACAVRLGSKRYEVVLYEQGGALGGQARGLMDEARLQAEIERQMGGAGVSLRLNARIEALADMEPYDACLIATGGGGAAFDCLEGYDAHSFGSRHPGVFIAGSVLGATPVGAIGQGLVAAHSIEKYIQVSLMDGIPETFLQTECLFEKGLAGVATAPAVPVPVGTGRYAKEDAVREAGRCLECDCTLCMDACELFGLFGQKPRRMINAAYTSLGAGRGGITKQDTTNLISSCTLCGLCGEVCPKGIDIGRMAHDFRQFKTEHNQYPVAYSDFFLRDMDFSNGEAALCRPAPGGDGRAEHVFFPGCQLGAANPAYVAEAYRYLLGLWGDTAIQLRCCGAPADWSGDARRSEDALHALKDEWEALGRPAFVCACPTCMRHLAEFLPGAPVLSLYEVLAEHGLPHGAGMLRNESSTAPEAMAAVACVFDPCASRGFPEAQEAVRKVARALGWQLEELPYSRALARCCGTGGLTLGANPEFSGIMTESRIRESDRPFINYCTNCRDTFAAHGKACIHILDAVFGLEAFCGRLPSPGERRANKRAAKALALQEFFGEEAEAPAQDPFDARVVFSDAIKDQLRTGLILEDEACRVIRFCEETKLKVEGPEPGVYTGHLAIGLATYWVSWRASGGRYLPVNAYAHRVRILEEWKGGTGGGGEAGSPALPLSCVKCGVPLTNAKGKFAYMEREMHAEVPRCPVCGQVYLSEELIKSRILLIEKSLEDK